MKLYKNKIECTPILKSKSSVQTQSIKKTRRQNALNIAKKTDPKIALNNYNSFLPTVEKFTSYSVPI